MAGMTNVECRMSKENQMTEGQNSRSNNNNKPQPKYDLEERTAQFGESVIAFANTIPVTPVTQTPLGQVVRSCTSIGANYCEADDAGSKKEFRYRISLCKRESRESKHWLRMLAAAVP